MPTPAWDNPADFIDLGDFAVKGVIEFVPQGKTARNLDGTTRDITGIFDEPYLKAGLRGDYELDSESPRFTCVEGSSTGARKGDTLVVYNSDGKTVFGTYSIMTSPQPDGTGLETLELSKQD
jgi:hypothetical protein